jgi:hypothetical protein
MIGSALAPQPGMRGSMASGKQQLDDEDFPLAVREMSILTKNGTPVATAQTAALAEDVARRLNEDAARRQESVWSA